MRPCPDQTHAITITLPTLATYPLSRPQVTNILQGERRSGQRNTLARSGPHRREQNAGNAQHGCAAVHKLCLLEPAAAPMPTSVHASAATQHGVLVLRGHAAVNSCQWLQC